MKENFQIQDNLLWIHMPKELDHHRALFISRTADEKLLNDEVKSVVFDFGETEFMDSSGIGVIVGRYKKVEVLGGRIIVLHANKRIKKIILMSGLRNLVEIMD